MITRLLVANRGEIARRVFASCRALGIGTVAVFSDADAGAPHVAEADRAVRLPGLASAQTYLNTDAIVAAALAAGADAVHPGYGFGSEDPGLASAVIAAGLTWVGPPPEAMAAMALKVRARQRAVGAGVPVLPELDPAAVTRFPVLVKASAGGGGRGMRAVHDPAGLLPAIESARREAEAAFGDGTVFCEPLLTGARHIEVQVLADNAGTVWALTERDCSVQRRYAKVIEETPSPAVGPALRDRLAAAAAALARQVGYRSAGTVEFLVGAPGTDEAEEFYFLEFNTRLQVEHPVTELLHGIDLVAWQLAIAAGEPLPPDPPPAAGHAIEARIYAEDPADGYRPDAGPVHAFEIPDVDVRFGLPPGFAPATRPQTPVLRLDAGVRAGSTVPPHYDAMLAKVITWAPDRTRAVRRLAAALTGARIAGPATNLALLGSVLADTGFARHGADTSLLAGFDLAGTVPGPDAVRLAAAAAALARAAANRRNATVAPGVPAGWRNVYSRPQVGSFDGPHGRVDVWYRWDRTGRLSLAAPPDGAAPGDEAGHEAGHEAGGDLPAVADAAPGQVTLEVAGVRYRFTVTTAADRVWVHSPLGPVRLMALPRLPEPAAAAESGSLRAPMPGSVVKVVCSPGQPVAAGEVVLVLEAMKMEHQIAAPAAGVLTELRVSQGAQVNAGDVLAIVAEPETAEGATA
ncbi:MAG: biotin/lipoyl-binding protein [Actinomycetota bacterium]|nr:biotin/lipoyl-binding protein [Actinomycetota bacterium]